MLVVESLLITLLLVTLAVSSYTDCRESLIHNALLLRAGILAAMLDVLYYMFFGQQYLVDFLLNSGLFILIGLALYRFRIWAAGDSKLLFLVALAIPGRLYTLQDQEGAGIFIILLAFITAFCWVAGQGLYIGMREKNLFQRFGSSRMNIHPTRIIASYIMMVGVIQIFDCLLRSIMSAVIFQTSMVMQSCYCLLVLFMLYVRRKMNMKKIILTAGLSWMTVLVLVTSGIYHLQYTVSVSILAWAVFLIALRLVVEKYSYQMIPTSEVKAGQILTAATVWKFTHSRVKGLPICATEDLEARLTADEAESVHRWEKSKYGEPTVVVVRKIPFAIFLMIGTVFFLIYEIMGW